MKQGSNGKQFLKKDDETSVPIDATTHKSRDISGSNYKEKKDGQDYKQVNDMSHSRRIPDVDQTGILDIGSKRDLIDNNKQFYDGINLETKPSKNKYL